MNREPTNVNRLLALADRIETAPDNELDALCREIEGVDEWPNVNGSCAGYLYHLADAKRLIPANHLYSICYDKNGVRAVVALNLTEREHGFSAVRHGPKNGELRALIAACLRVRAAIDTRLSPPLPSTGVERAFERTMDRMQAERPDELGPWREASAEFPEQFVLFRRGFDIFAEELSALSALPLDGDGL